MKEKIRIMKTKPQVSDEEIRALMDFDGLLAKRNLLAEPADIWSKKIILKLVLVAMIFSATVFYFTAKENSTMAVQGGLNPAAHESTPAFLKGDSLHLKEDLRMDTSPVQEQSVERENHIKRETPGTRKDALLPSVEEAPREKESVYVQAEPAQGYPALYDYFERQLVYPPAVIKDSIEGVVNVVFEIDTTGVPINTVVENSLGPLFDKEAIRLVENMPLWKPAYYNGKPMKSKISLPITFGITRISNP